MNKQNILYTLEYYSLLCPVGLILYFNHDFSSHSHPLYSFDIGSLTTFRTGLISCILCMK